MSQNKITGRRLSLVALVIALSAGGYIFYRSKTTNDDRTVSEFKTLTIARGDIKITVRATGTVKPENRLEINPPINFKVTFHELCLTPVNPYTSLCGSVILSRP